MITSLIIFVFKLPQTIYKTFKNLFVKLFIPKNKRNSMLKNIRHDMSNRVLT